MYHAIVCAKKITTDRSNVLGDLWSCIQEILHFCLKPCFFFQLNLGQYHPSHRILLSFQTCLLNLEEKFWVSFSIRTFCFPGYYFHFASICWICLLLGKKAGFLWGFWSFTVPKLLVERPLTNFDNSVNFSNKTPFFVWDMRRTSIIFLLFFQAFWSSFFFTNSLLWWY